MKNKMKRPLGLTLMAINLRKENNPNAKKEFQNYVIKQYIQNGFQYNNQPTDLESLANLLDIRIEYLVKRIARLRGVFFDVEERQGVKDVLGVMVMKIFESTIRDRAKVEAQTERIEGSLNGQQYKPFISAELTKALANNLASQKAMIDAANLFAKMANIGPTSGPNIQINNTNQPTINQGNLITVDKAVALLAEDKNQILIPEDTKAILAQEYLHDAPDINPNTQVGYGSDRSVVNVLKAKKIGHEDRREGPDEIVS